MSSMFLLLSGFLFMTDGACYIPRYYDFYDYYDIHTSAVVKYSTTSKPRAASSAKTTESTSLAKTTVSTEITPKKTCSIWCWIRKVGLFIVQQLLSEDD